MILLLKLCYEMSFQLLLMSTVDAERMINTDGGGFSNARISGDTVRFLVVDRR